MNIGELPGYRSPSCKFFHDWAYTISMMYRTLLKIAKHPYNKGRKILTAVTFLGLVFLFYSWIIDSTNTKWIGRIQSGLLPNRICIRCHSDKDKREREKQTMRDIFDSFSVRTDSKCMSYRIERSFPAQMQQVYGSLWDLEQLQRFWAMRNGSTDVFMNLREIPNLNEKIKSKNASLDLKQFLSSNSTCKYSTEIFRGNKVTSDFKANDKSQFTRIKIEERCTPTRSSGGSSFRVTVKGGNGTDVCATKDFFNGSYLAFCPFRGPNAPHTITLLYRNFTAYFMDAEPITKVIFSDESHATIEGNNTDENCYSGNKYERPISNIRNSGRWIYDGCKWQWLVEENILPHITKEFLGNLTDSVNTLTFLGDSHMRYFYYYLLRKINRLAKNKVQKLNSTQHYENIIFHWGGFASSLGRHLENIYNHCKNTANNTTQVKKDILLIGCGHWDLKKKTVYSYVEGMLTVFGALRKIKSECPHVKMVWTTMAPEKDKTGDEISNFLISALSAWVQNNFCEIGIDIFEYFQMVRPVRNVKSQVCHHYLCVMRATGLVDGDAGIAAADLLYHYLRSIIDSYH